MHEPEVRILAGREANEGGRPDPQEPSAKQKHKWLLTTVISLSVAALAVGLTYSAVVNNWMPTVTGLFYTEAEYDSGLRASYDEGEDAGYQAGFEEGETLGFANGEDAGFEQGYATGAEEGYANGASDGYDEGYDAGYAQGESGGWDVGYGSGYLDGWTDGCVFLFTGLGTDRVGDWWDYYYSSYYGSYYERSVC